MFKVMMQSKKTERIKELKSLAKDACDEDRMPVVAELLECYLEHFPDDSRAWFLYGDAQRLLGRFREAEVSLRNAERLCPPDHAWEVQCRLGLVFKGNGDYIAAERLYAQALESEEARQANWLWIYRGINFAMQELNDKAEACYKSAITLDERDEEAHLNLAMVYRSQGRYEEARSAAETALVLCPDYPAATELISSLEGAEAARSLVEDLRGLDA